jgi:TolB-like protein/DNA-binding SARP family transcriptional activator/Tfp pilus assembly protein PilF
LLVSARGAGASREKLIRFLWPDVDPDRARRLLSDSVYRINAALGGDAVAAAGDELRLNADRLTSDVGDFGAACERADWALAVGLYTGPFLDGFSLPGCDEFDHWVDGERERLRRAYAHALDTLAGQAEQAGDWELAAARWRALAVHDPLSSRVALKLIDALAKTGERAAALQHARVHGIRLREELGIEAGPEILERIEELRSAGQQPSAPPSRSVEPLSTDSFAPGIGASPQAAAPRRTAGRSLRSIRWVAATLLLLALAALGITRLQQNRTVPTSVAVLPFVDHSPRHDRAYFTDGLTEELINTLSRVNDLRVAARTSSFALKDVKLDVREVGQRLGVNAVLEGSVREEDGRLRIAVQLVDARNGYEIWSKTYNRATSDLLVVQEEIARAIVDELKITLLPGEEAALASTPIDPESYNLFLKGRYHWHRRGPQDLQISVESLQEVVRRAPTFARGWAGLADAYAISGFYDYQAPRSAFPQARAAAERALQLDARLAAAFNTLGYVALYYEWDFQRAEDFFVRAIQLDSAYSMAHQWYGNLLTAAGRFSEAERAMRQAQVLDPLSLIASAAHGWSLYFARRYADANAQLLRTIALDSTFHLAHLWRGFVLEELGQRDSMQVSLERGARLARGSAIHVSALARGFALRGDRDQARRLLSALQNGKHGYAPAYELAKVYLGLDLPERAIDLLEQAVQDRAHSLAFVRVDPQLDALRMHPRFLRLVSRVMP